MSRIHHAKVVRVAIITFLALSLVSTENAFPKFYLPFFGNGASASGTKIPCAFGCGERGVINTRFAGDAFSTYITGPTVDKYEDASLRTVNLADRLLGQRITELTTALKGSQDELTLQLEAATADLDLELTRLLSEGEEILDRRLVGALNTVIQRSLIQLLSVLQSITLILAIFSLALFIASLLSKRIRIKHPTLKPITTAIFFGALLAWTGTGLLSWWQSASLRAMYEEQFRIHLSELNFRYALYYATQLQILNHENPVYDANVEKVGALRYAFSSSSGYKTSTGLQQLDQRIRQAKEYLSKAGVNTDSDITTLECMVGWQLANDRIQEYSAASHCTTALKLALSLHDRWSGNPSGAKPLLCSIPILGSRLNYCTQTVTTAYLAPLAAHYVRSYLVGALGKGELKIADPDGAIGLNNLSPPDEMKNTLNEWEKQSVGQSHDISNLGDFSVYIKYGELVQDLYRVVVPSYTKMIAYNAYAAATNDPNDFILRNNEAARIHAAWMAFLEQLQQPALQNQNVWINSVRLVAPIDARARAYLGGTSKSGQSIEIKEGLGNLTRGYYPVTIMANAPLVKAIVPELYTENDPEFLQTINYLVRTHLSLNTYDLLKSAASKDYVNIQKEFVTFEKSVLDLVSSRISYDNANDDVKSTQVGLLQDKASAAAVAAMRVGLFSCNNKVNGNDGADKSNLFGFGACDSGDPERTVAEMMLSILPERAQINDLSKISCKYTAPKKEGEPDCKQEALFYRRFMPVI